MSQKARRMGTVGSSYHLGTNTISRSVYNTPLYWIKPRQINPVSKVRIGLDFVLLWHQARASFGLPLCHCWCEASSQLWGAQASRDLLETCFMILQMSSVKCSGWDRLYRMSPSLWRTPCLVFLSHSQRGIILAQTWTCLPFKLFPTLGNYSQAVTISVTGKLPHNICDKSHLHYTKGKIMQWCVKWIILVYHPTCTVHKKRHLLGSQRKWYITEHAGWGTDRL